MIANKVWNHNKIFFSTFQLKEIFGKMKYIIPNLHCVQHNLLSFTENYLEKNSRRPNYINKFSHFYQRGLNYFFAINKIFNKNYNLKETLCEINLLK